MANRWENVKREFLSKHGIELLDEDQADYKHFMKKGMVGGLIFTLFGVGILIFILTGLIIGTLTWDVYTIVPLVIITVIIVSSANSMKNKALKNEREFANFILAKRKPIEQQSKEPPKSLISAEDQVQVPKKSSQKDTMFCRYCGAVNYADAKFCSTCGKNLE